MKILIIAVIISICPLLGQVADSSNDGNQSKLLTIGETGLINPKGTGFLKAGINFWLPTLQVAYSPFNNWEFDFFTFEVPELGNDTTKFDPGIYRIGFKYQWLNKQKFLYTKSYHASTGIKLHRFVFSVFDSKDSLAVDKDSWFIIPYVAQTFSWGRLKYHLYLSVPLGGEKTKAVGTEDKEPLTVITISGLEWAKSPNFKYVLEYWYTNLGGFIDISTRDVDNLSFGYNPDGAWISYMFMGARLSYTRHFYSELGISSHYTFPAIPATGIVLNLGWYFR
jgi:hypothetical protein